MEKKDTPFIPVEVLRDFSVRSFKASGLSQEHSGWISDTLIQSELRGVGSHGIVRLPFYCKRLLDGGSNVNPNVRIVAQKPASILVDGDNGLGQIVSIKAMEMVIERARTQGICFGGVRNSCHFGMTAYYPMMALKSGMIGLAGCNTAIGHGPLGRGEVRDREQPPGDHGPDEQALPPRPRYGDERGLRREDTAGGGQGDEDPSRLDPRREGPPHGQPEDMFPNGTLLPMGYKGFGMAIMIEILSGVLSRAATLSEIPLWFDKTTTPTNLGHFFMAIDIGTFLTPDSFKDMVGRLIDELKASPPMEGSEGSCPAKSNTSASRNF